jgi:hypothetical protein
MPGRAGRAATLLPTGTLAVGAGLLVLGAGMYVHIAVAGHGLPATGMAAVSVLWSLVFLLGLGVFLPVEQSRPRRCSTPSNPCRGTDLGVNCTAVAAR